ncbi:MAG: hypothetical protein HYS14_11925 [Candidatus Rokubacteria bacterium]|nr:hypothetical protein [Candidatus Rokubacteria bacterium]
MQGLSRTFLQVKYVGRLLWELPAHYLKWVVFGRDPLLRKMFWERLGIVPRPPGVEDERVVIDTNGHGEYNQIHTFVQLFRLRYPDWKIILISWNPEIVELASTNKNLDLVCFAPWDAGWIARRYLRALSPRLLISVDQVRFPLLLKAAKVLGIRTILVSASLPEVYIGSVHLKKALAYRFHRYFDRICVAEEDDRRNYVRIGCEERKVSVTGYMKFDMDHLKTTAEERGALRGALGLSGTEVVWIAGSVRRGEERLILDAYGRLRRNLPDVRLILAPRYVKDVGEVCRVAEEQGLKYVLRTQIQGSTPGDAVIVLDTYGELGKLYSIADVVFIGNSLNPGDQYALGQNLIEPLVHGKPVLFGPFMNKWKPLTTSLKEAWPGLEVRDSAELASHIAHLIQNHAILGRVKRKIGETLERNRMAVTNNFSVVVDLLERG